MSDNEAARLFARLERLLRLGWSIRQPLYGIEEWALQSPHGEEPEYAPTLADAIMLAPAPPKDAP